MQHGERPGISQRDPKLTYQAKKRLDKGLSSKSGGRQYLLTNLLASHMSIWQMNMRLTLPLAKISDCASQNLVKHTLCILCKAMGKTDAIFFDRKANQKPDKDSYDLLGRTPPLQQTKVEERMFGAEVIEESKQEILVTRVCLSSFMTKMCINNRIKDILCITLVILVSRAKLIFISGQSLLVSLAYVQNFSLRWITTAVLIKMER